MANILLFFDISKIIFIAAYGLLIVFLLLQIKKMEKIARPFMISMILYFVCDLLGDTLQYWFNRSTDYNTNPDLVSNAHYQLLVSMNLLGVIIVLVGPMYLIFILEKKAFQKSLVKEKHILTILQVSLFLVLLFVGFSVYFMSGNSSLIGLIFVFFAGIIFIQVIFFFAGFLYISIKSTGQYRRRALLVSLGYIWQFMVNAFYFFVIQSYQIGDHSYGSSDFYNFPIIYCYVSFEPWTTCSIYHSSILD